MLEINKAQYISDYNIQLVFNNGRAGIANLEETIFKDKRPVFAKLQDQSVFKDFKVEHSTVTWPDKLDMAAEYLFYLAFKNDPDLQGMFKAWGYIA